MLSVTIQEIRRNTFPIFYKSAKDSEQSESLFKPKLWRVTSRGSATAWLDRLLKCIKMRPKSKKEDLVPPERRRGISFVFRTGGKMGLRS